MKLIIILFLGLQGCSMAARSLGSMGEALKNTPKTQNQTCMAQDQGGGYVKLNCY